MTELTTSRKIFVLQRMASLLKASRLYYTNGMSGTHYGLCQAFADAYTYEAAVKPTINGMLGAIPELIAFKPIISEDHPYWFDRNNFDKRIRICERVVVEIEKQLLC